MFQLGQYGFHLVDGLDHIGLRLLGDQQQNSGLAVKPSGGAGIADPLPDLGHIPQSDGRFVADRNHNFLEIFDALQL